MNRIAKDFFRPDGQLSVLGLVFAFVAAETNLFVEIRLFQVFWHWLVAR
jgi:hypothetical protein